jgi:PD-(D/E)XK nuclease superfamily
MNNIVLGVKKEGNMRLGCTNIEILQQCPTRYLLQAKYGVYSAPGLAAMRGSEMHHILETALTKGKDLALLRIDTLTEKLKTYADYFRAGLEGVLLELSKLEDFTIIKTEQKLSYQYDNETEMTGRYDLLMSSSGRKSLVDYKTSSTKWNPDKILSGYQLPFYGYQLLKKEGVRVDNLVVINIYGQKTALIQSLAKPFTDEDIIYVEALVNYVKAFEKRGIYEKSWSNCGWCDVKPNCHELPLICKLPQDDELIRNTIAKLNGALVK